MSRSRSTAAFTLLVAGLQLAGGGIVATGNAGPSATEYFCCCTGECHCTADCCNHAPESADSTVSTELRIGAGSDVLQAPRSCGTWAVTLGRSPGSPKAFPARQLRLAGAPPERRFLDPHGSVSVDSSRASRGTQAPRAPPVPLIPL